MEALTRGARTSVVVAAVAAAVATVGDLFLLYVVNAQRAALELAAPPPWVLPVGAALGVLAIPFYALGYRGIAGALAARAPTRARIVQGAGAVTAILGAVIHGSTGRMIAHDLVSSDAALPPFEAMMAWNDSPLPALWAVATLLVVLASVAMVREAGEHGLPLTVRIFNPVALTIAVGVVGLGSELGRSFLTPAAPNIAHGLCFVWAARVLERARSVTRIG